jgi:hypothetical protein
MYSNENICEKIPIVREELKYTLKNTVFYILIFYTTN